MSTPLQVVVPLIVADANITASNVARETAWTAGTYNLGETRRVGERLFEVSKSPDTTEEPTATATDWFDAGPANRYAAFDRQVGIDKYRVVETKTSNADSITYTLEALTRIGGIAMFGLQAESISIVATVNTTGDAANISYTLQDDTQYNGSMWRWMFVPASFERKYINLQLNIAQGASIDLTITNTGDTAKVGTIAMGLVSSVGVVGEDTGRRLKSRSFKKTEGTLTSLLQRTTSSIVSYKLTLLDGEGDAFQRLMQDIDGIGAVFVATNLYPEFSIYGTLSSANATAHVGGTSKLIIEAEEL
jgi:hypothetical protein